MSTHPHKTRTHPHKTRTKRAHIAQKKRKKGELRAEILAYFERNPDTAQSTQSIIAAVNAHHSAVSRNLTRLVAEGEITQIRQGLYRKNKKNMSIRAQPSQNTLEGPPVTLRDLKANIRVVRTQEQNNALADALLNAYEILLYQYTVWLISEIEKVDFKDRLACVETFKILVLMGDRLLKRWAIEHQGYDTNTRQAQEDAKAKTEERQKKALKDAPLEEQITVVASYDLDAKQLIDNFPTLEDLTKAEVDDTTI